MNLSNEFVIHKQNNGVEYLQFKRLLEYSNIINHAYSLGVDVNFRTLKANKQSIGEVEYNNAIKCYKDLCNEINSDCSHIVKTNQEHTKTVKIVEEKYNLNAPDIGLVKYKSTDGLITNKKNIMLSTTNADCILLLFFDPINRVIANVHSGWRGTLQQISVNTVTKMKENYNCNPQDIICCICPSIRKCHFEVDKDVRDLFYNEFKDLENIHEIIEENLSKQKWNIDTVLINKTILKKEGLQDKNIIDCGICSVCNSNIIHSFRAEKEGYGLETALIELK